MPSLRFASSLTLRIGILIPLFVLVGCAGLGKTLEPPRINLSNVQFQESKALETVLQKEKLKFGVSGRLHLEGGFLVPSVFPFKAEEELALEGFDKRK